MKKARSLLARPAAQVALITGAVGLLHFALFGVHFGLLHSGPGGDTQNVWSAYWIALYSLREFGELQWWDPTALGGWPAYYLSHHGWTTLLSPFQLAQLSLGMAVSAVAGLDITQTLVLQKTVFVVLLNIAAVALISRELVTSLLARVLAPLVYALCQIQFLGFIAAATVDALPQALFLLYGMVRYNNRRTPGDLLLLLLFTGIYAVSVNYMTLTSHVYPLGFLALFMAALQPGLARSAWEDARTLTRTRAGLAALAAGLFLIVAGLIAFRTGIAGNIGSLARLATGTVPYDLGSVQFPGPGRGITSTDVWTNLFYWIPYGDFHAFTLDFDPYSAGHEYRYIGLATLPLIAIAALSGQRRRDVACLGLAFFMCVCFVTLTYRNLPFSVLIEHSSVFQNIRTMALVMPRDLACLFPILIAAIGLDAVAGRATLGAASWRRAAEGALGAFFVLGLLSLLLVALSPEHKPVRMSLGHIGVYLMAFCAILYFALRVPEAASAARLGWVLLLLVVVDLVSAASYHWFEGNKGRYHHGRGPTTMEAEAEGIGPLASEAASWPGTYYAGMVHNVHHGGPHFGSKYWLALVTRPAWQPVVDNWNPATRMMTRYPHFKFYTNAAFVPENAVLKLDAVQPPATEAPPRLQDGPGGEIRLDGVRYPLGAADLGLVELAEPSKAWSDRHTIVGWAFDKAAGLPARYVLVFVDGELWYWGSPNRRRDDIAGDSPALRRSGFYLEIPALPERAVKRAASVRVFAMTQGGEAAELRYAPDYPFSTARPKPAAARPAERASTGPTFYVHDEALVKPGVQGRRMRDAKWEVVEFTLNRVKVKVDLPEAGFMLHLDNYDRHWRASVNGAAAPVHRANFAFKAVALPAGASVVELSFNPMRSKIAWLVYYAAFAAALFTLVAWRRRTRAAAAA